MKTNINKRIAYVFLFAILIFSAFLFINGARFFVDGAGHDPSLSVGEEVLPPVQESTPSDVLLDKVASPIAGRTSWADTEKGRPLGFVVYLNNGILFTTDQINLQMRLNTATLAKITFTRGEKTETPVLICAGVDGGYGSKSFFAFFFGGDLSWEALNEYREGDKVAIEEGCVLKCSEGNYKVTQKIEYEYDGKQWTAEKEVSPETIEYSSTGVPVDGVTNYGKTKGYVGIVLYNNGWTFAKDQGNLENKPWTRTKKVTFMRGTAVEECVFIVAGHDGTNNFSFCAYFFGGDLVNTSLSAGDTVKIKGDFAFTTAEGRYSYGKDLEFIFDGTTWIDKASGDKDFTYITYISEPQEDESGEKILFSLKTTALFSAGDLVTDDIKQSVFINGVSVTGLGDKADIAYSASRIVLSVDKSELKLDDFDTISVKAGALLIGSDSDGLKLKDDETFRYSHTLKRVDLIPSYDYYGAASSFAIIDNIEIAGDSSSVEINNIKYDLAHSVWIHFKWAAKTNYDNFQTHLTAEQLVAKGVLNEKLCYEYQKLGFFYSVTDLIKVNGKSIYEWMITDAKHGKGNCIKVEYLPYEIDSGRVLRILVADESLLDIGVGVDQSIEFKKGFINPALGEIQKDSVYSIKAEDATVNNKFNMGVKQESKQEEKKQSSGCGGEIRAERFYGFFLACAVLLSSFVFVKTRGRKGDK